MSRSPPEGASSQRTAWGVNPPHPHVVPTPHCLFFGLASGDTLSQGRKVRTISYNSRGRVCAVDQVHGATQSCAIQRP